MAPSLEDPVDQAPLTDSQQSINKAKVAAEQLADSLTHDVEPQTKSSSTNSYQSINKFELQDHPIDVRPPIRVAVIGAGLSGVIAGTLLPAKVPGIDLTIFEKNTDVGGTWFENVYPGVRCDVPANVYQSTFESNTQWSEEYAQGAEIRDYWQGLAHKYNVYKYLKLGKKITAATWDQAAGKWTLGVEDVTSQSACQERFDVVILAIGRFNAFKLPEYPGIKDFEGLLRHSSNWDPTFDPKDQRVAVIGNGASGIQVVPNLQPLVARLDHYARSPTWIAGTFGGEGPGRRLVPNYYDKELLASFANDPEAYYTFRKELETKFYRLFAGVFRGTDENVKLKDDFVKMMGERLKKKPELLEHLLPDFPPNCRRLTPGPGYLEALQEDNVSYIRTPISHFTEDGIVTTDGTERKVDAVICSTGANIDLIPPFPITANGKTLREAWDPDPFNYLGVSAPGFPNLCFICGPQGTGHSGTVPQQVETQVTYLAKLLRKVTNQGIKAFVPSQAAVDDYTAYCDAFFAKTVWTENCSSWANGGKPGGRVYGHWPGSASHCTEVRKEPRWEDFEWTYKGGSNRFGYFGNGWTEKARSGVGDLTPYLKVPGTVDLRSVHEDWFEGL